MAFNNNEVARKWAKNRGAISDDYGIGNAKKITFSESAPPPGASPVRANPLAIYGLDLSDHAQKQIKEAYASTFANSYDYNVDQERMAKGLMPTAFDSKYQDTELDRLLYSMGLPSAADLPKAVDDYNEKTAPERQYQQVYKAIGKDVRPFLDENGELSENKVLDYLYGNVFNSEEYKALNDEWKEKKTETVTAGTSYEETLRDQLEAEGAYNIDRLMEDLNKGLQKANMWSGLAPVSSEKAGEDTGFIHTVGQVAEHKTAEEDYFDKSEKVQQLYDEIRFLSQSGIDTTEKQAELDALIENTKQADPKRQQKEQWKAEDALLEEAVDLSLFRRENIPFSGQGEVMYSDELQSQVDAFREQQIANGMTPLQVDNIIRRSGLNEYLGNNTEIADYAASVIAEQNGITFDQAMAEYNAMPQSEKDMYAMDMQFDNRVHNSVTEEAGRAAAAIPARVAIDIVNSAFNFADMMNPVSGIQDAIYDMADIADPSKKARETLNAVSWKLGQFGSSENHEFINVASDVTTELIRMYAVNAAGVALAQGVNAPALAGKTTASEKGMGVLLNKMRKAFSAQSAPFIASAMGSYYNEAMSEGASRGQATAYGLIAGMFEGALESLGADEIFQKTFTKGFIQRGKAGSEYLLSKGVSRFVDFTANMIGNGLEEGASYVVSGIAARTIYDKDRELSWEEFWGNAGMGALIGMAGSIATMGEGSRSYDLLQEAIDSQNASLFDQAYAAYAVETMPQGKIEAYGEGQELSVEEYRQAAGDRYKSLMEQENAKKQYDAQVASADERVVSAKKTVDGLKARLAAVELNGKEDAALFEQLSKEIKSAQLTYDKTVESANAAKETASKEYENRVAVLKQQAIEAERKMEAHAVAFDRASRIDSADYVDGYLEAVDPNLIGFVEAATAAEKQSLKPYELKPVSDRAAEDIMRLTGVDASGFSTAIEQKQARHIVKDHGESGLSDHSMADPRDIGRIQFVLDNYDAIEATGRATKGYREPISGTGMNRSAQTVRFSKRVNGTYYVVEAIPDTQRKTAFVVTAYKTKKGTDQVADAEAPTLYVQDDAELVPNESVAQSQPLAQEEDSPELKQSVGAALASDFATKVSKVYSNTYNAMFDAAEREQAGMQPGDFGYYEVTEKGSTKEARARLDEYSVDELVERLNASPQWGSVDLDTAMGILSIYRAEAAETGDYSKVLDWATTIQEHGTVSGQMIQAFAKYSRSQLGTLVRLDSIVDQINKDFAKSLKKAGKETVEISEESRKKLLDAKNQEEIDAVLDDIADEISAQLPGTLAEKINAWRYMAMLGNPKTHVRNIVGNLFMRGLQKAKIAVGAGLEKIAVKDEAQRTKAFVNRHSEEGKALYEYAKSTLPDVEAKLSGNKESIKVGDRLRDKVAERRTIFGLKPVEGFRKLNDRLLNYEDLEMFGKPAYFEAYANAMKARGLTPETITAEQRSEIADIAVEEALRTTFRDASALANAINKIENQNSVSKLLVGGLLPFKKTPINVLKRGVEYSPIGILQGLKQLGVDVKQGKVTAAQAVDRISSGIVGTALFGLGMLLAKSGILRAGGEDDENYEYYLKDLGYQTYSLRFGDSSFTIDWATPGTIPLFIGAELQGAMEGTSKFSFNGIMEALSETADPLVQLSMLQGVADAISAVGSEEGASAIGELAFSSMQNYASQFVPSVFGQIARTVDPVRRSTTGDPNAALGAAPDKALRKMAAKIPGLSAVLEPYVDKRGEVQDDTHWAVRLLENTLLPGYIEKVDMTNVDEEITRLYMQTERKDIFPKSVDRRLKTGGKTYVMTADEYTQYQKDVGKQTYIALDSVISNPAYSSLTDELKAQSLKQAIEDAHTIVREEYKAKFFVEPQS